MIFHNIKIISGGQTGVDRAALDYALKQRIPCGGWCPKGRRADAGPIPVVYPLLETTSAEYPKRTGMNTMHSDGTLIITRNHFFDRGTALTHRLCDQHGKPCLVIDLDQPHEPQIENLQAWIRDSEIHILNIAGPRERALPGIYQETLQFLEEMDKWR
jgi:hypothetical protein